MRMRTPLKPPESANNDSEGHFDDLRARDGLALVAASERGVPENMKQQYGLWDKVRIFLSRSLYSYLGGITAEDLIKLFQQNSFSIDAPYWSRALTLCLTSPINSFLHRNEERLFGSSVAKVAIQPPLFILGHWRHGTTYLHRLLAVDPQFAFPNQYQVLFPHTFLMTESIGSRMLANLLPRKRLMDNVRVNVSMPHEDEFALCISTLMSPLLGMIFPRRADYYEQYLTFRGVSDKEIDYWKRRWLWFLKKLTWKYSRPLLLKSPPHTCRIRLLLQLFPEARFVHIHRNPYAAFQSVRHWHEKITPTYCLQRSDSSELEFRILERYQRMYEIFFEERKLIPDGQFQEVCFEELERDPVAQIQTIYKKLSIRGFADVHLSWRSYVTSQRDYQRNEFPELPLSLRQRIARAWQQCFEKWGYTTNAGRP